MVTFNLLNDLFVAEMTDAVCWRFFALRIIRPDYVHSTERRWDYHYSMLLKTTTLAILPWCRLRILIILYDTARSWHVRDNEAHDDSDMN